MFLYRLKKSLARKDEGIEVLNNEINELKNAQQELFIKQNILQNRQSFNQDNVENGN